MIENFVVVGGLVEVHKALFLLFCFLFLLYLKNRGGRCCSCCKGGNRLGLCEWWIFGERDAFWNYKPLVGNTDSVEPRILSPYHAPRSLECTRNGSVSEDEVHCS